MALSGSPGAKYTNMNDTTVTLSAMGNAYNKRLRKYVNI